MQFYYFYNHQPEAGLQPDNWETDSNSSTIIGSVAESSITLVEGSHFPGLTTEARIAAIDFLLRFRKSMAQLAKADVSEYLPFFGVSLLLDLEMLNYLRTELEAGTLNFSNIIAKMETPSLEIFTGPCSIFFPFLWKPSDIYPDFESFYTDFISLFNSYSSLDID